MPSIAAQGGGGGWGAEKLGHLAEALIESSVDAVTGIDQTGQRFKTHLDMNFVAKNPSVYNCRTVARVKGKFVFYIPTNIMRSQCV